MQWREASYLIYGVARSLLGVARSLLLHLTSFLCPFLEEGEQLTTVMVREICVRGE
jgi:hypothetical protein